MIKSAEVDQAGAINPLGSIPVICVINSCEDRTSSLIFDWFKHARLKWCDHVWFPISCPWSDHSLTFAAFSGSFRSFPTTNIERALKSEKVLNDLKRN